MLSFFSRSAILFPLFVGLILSLSGCLGTEGTGVTHESGNGSGGAEAPEFRGVESATAESIDAIKLEWILPTFEQDYGSLNVYEVIDGNQLNLLAVVGSNENSFFHTGLLPGSTHTYQVSAVSNELGTEVENQRKAQATTLSSDGNPLSISETDLTLAFGQEHTFSGSGGTPPYQFQIVSGPGAILDPSSGGFIALFSRGLAVVKMTDSVGANSYAAINVTQGFQVHPPSFQLIKNRAVLIEVAGAQEPVTFSLVEGESIVTLRPDGMVESLGGLGLAAIRVQDGTGLSRDVLIQTVNEMNPQSQHLMAMGTGHNCYSKKQSNNIQCWGNRSSGAVPSATGIHIGDQPGEMGDALPETNLGENNIPVAIKAGDNFTCALFINNQLKCWGEGSFGKLLSGSTDDIGVDPTQLADGLPFLNFGTGRSVVDFAVGAENSCVLLDNNEVKCWGRNRYGALGQPSLQSYGDSVLEIGNGLPAVDLGNVVVKKLTGAGHHYCVQLIDDSLKCWGRHNVGQLGLGNVSDQGDAAEELGDGLPLVLGPGSVKDVVASSNRTCIITPADKLVCWGGNPNGELGQENTTSIGIQTSVLSTLPSTIRLDDADLFTVKSVTSSSGGTCAILSGAQNGQMKCWGNAPEVMSLSGDLGNEVGEMGDALPFMNFGSFNGSNETVKKVSMGPISNFGCAHLNSNRLKCWGTSNFGQIGQGDLQVWGNSVAEQNDGLPYVNLGTGRTIKDIAVGNRHACAILDTDKIKCWGAEVDGSLGHGTARLGDSPGEMASVPDIRLGDSLLIKKIVGMNNATCALYFDGRMKCFGDAGSGRLASGSTADRGDNANEVTNTLPFSVLSDTTTIKDLDGGHTSSCAIMSNDRVKCWGNNSTGALGLGHTITMGDSPAEVGSDANLPFVDLGLTNTVKKLSVGTQGACVITTVDEVKCWGRNLDGALGLGHENPVGDEPGEMGINLQSPDLGVSPSIKPVDVEMGYYGACVTFENGKIKCWGRNNRGQVGLGNNSDQGNEPGEMGVSLPFVDLGSDFYVIKVVSQLNTYCALSKDHRVKCWGGSDSGKTGYGHVANIGTDITHMGDNLPTVDFGAFRKVVDLFEGSSAGHYFCAILDNNEIKCWGRNNFGQLGMDDTEDRGDQIGEMGDSLSQILLAF